MAPKRFVAWKTIVFILFFAVGAHASEQRRFVALRAGYARLASSLTGTGFNADFPNRSSFLYGAEVTYQRSEDAFGFEFRYDKTTSNATAPDGLSPSDISAFREDMAFYIVGEPGEFGLGSKVRLKFGYGTTTTGATATSPNEIMTTQKTKSALLGILFESKLAERWNFATDAQLSLPFSIVENDQVTGHSPAMFGFDMRATAEHTFKEKVVGFIGVGFRYDRASFSGSVSRGVTDGIDVRTLFTIPVGVRIGY